MAAGTEETTAIPDLANLKEESTATVHGVLTALSPIKKGTRSPFFDSYLVDNKARARLVGFELSHRQELSDFMEKKVPIKVDDCEIKHAFRGSKMEIVLKGTTKITQSPKKFEVDPTEFDEKIPVNLKDLADFSVYDRVTVLVKVHTVFDQVDAGKFKKQDVLVVDNTGTTTVTLWENNIGDLQEDSSYCLESFVVREFASKKYITKGKSNSLIKQIADIGEVLYQTSASEAKYTIIQNPTIVAVNHLHQYSTCLRCKARVEPSTPPLGRCTKNGCNMTQKFKSCPTVISAKLLFMADSKFTALTVPEHILRDMMAGQDITEENIIKLPNFKTIKYIRESSTLVSFTI